MPRWPMLLAACVALSACDSEPFVPDGTPTQAVVARIDVTVPAGEMNPGDTVTATARAFASNGNPVPLVDFRWQSTDSSVVSVEAHTPTETARVSALALGSASVTARVGGLASTPVVVTVVEPDSTDTGGL